MLDLGCGPGRSTRILAEALPHADFVGVDLSPEMIARAHHTVPYGGRVAFVEADATGAAGVQLVRDLKRDPFTAIVPVVLLSSRHEATEVEAWFEAESEAAEDPATDQE